jgi:Glycosyl transferases group 1
LPWIADFRDPWAHVLPEKQRPQWQRHFLERLEERCIYAADLILCNTERMRRSFQSHYADLEPSRFRTLPNGYDDVQVPTSHEKDSRRVFLHLGSIYGLRRIDTFLQAITELMRSGRLTPDSFRLVFQGDVSAESLLAAERDCRDLMIKGCLEFRPRVSWSDAQGLLWSADRLLLFQGQHALQVPAKFYEYLQTGIPIFAVTEEGALSELLTSTRSGLWAKPENPAPIAERFMQVLEMPRHSPDYIERNLNAKFHFRYLSAQLGEWIRELLGHKNPERVLSSDT